MDGDDHAFSSPGCLDDDTEGLPSHGHIRDRAVWVVVVDLHEGLERSHHRLHVGGRAAGCEEVYVLPVMRLGYARTGNGSS